jgi:hypothetical protein
MSEPVFKIYLADQVWAKLLPVILIDALYRISARLVLADLPHVGLACTFSNRPPKLAIID